MTTIDEAIRSGQRARANTNGAMPTGDQPPLRLPDECWRPVFDDYRRALEGVTEAADEHHFLALMAVVGCVLGRRVSFDYAYPLYPNFYALNVGPSGSTKKTAALRLAADVGFRADPKLSVRWMSGSAEGLLEALAGSFGGRLLLLQSELSQLLGKAKQEGSSTLIPVLLEAFDCPPLLNPPTRKNPIKAVEPTLTMLAATTLVQLEKYLGFQDLHGGLGSRLIIAIGEPKDPIPLPRRVEPHQFNSIVAAIHGALERWGRRGPPAKPTLFTMTSEAETRWREAYIAWKAREPQLGASADLVSRTHVYAIKMAMVFAALENDTPVIEAGQLEAAIQAANFTQECALTLLRDFGDSKTTHIEARIMRRVGKQPGISIRKMQQSLGGDCDSITYRRLLEAMLETGKLLEVGGGLHVGD